jgi:hypothetical protein
VWACITLLPSCADKVEPIPSYIHISRFELNTDGTTYGSNSHDIVDAWVYVDNKFIGAFEVPTTIPILASGAKQLTIIAGIKKNGLIYEREPYPFFAPFSVSHNFIPAQVDTILPVVTYRSNVKMPWLEDFEDRVISFTKSGVLTTTDSFRITDLPNEVFSFDGVKNKYSGKIAMPSGLQIFENSSIESYDLPRSGQEIYLEMDFKCNTEFVTGIYPITGSTITGVPIVNFFSTIDASGQMQWKKAYVSLKEDVNNAQFAGADFRIFINAQTNTNTSTPLIYIDNVKLVHY